MLCIIYRIISNSLNYDFPAWERIIAAATIASFFFSISSYHKYDNKLKDKFALLIKENNEILSNYEKQAERYPSVYEKGGELYNEIVAQKKINQANLAKAIRSGCKAKKISFILDVVGYIAFFCILSFDMIFSRVLEIQDICTLGAFLTVVIIEYFEANITDCMEASFCEMRKLKKEILEREASLEKIYSIAEKLDFQSPTKDSVNEGS